MTVIAVSNQRVSFYKYLSWFVSLMYKTSYISGIACSQVNLKVVNVFSVNNNRLIVDVDAHDNELFKHIDRHGICTRMHNVTRIYML